MEIKTIEFLPIEEIHIIKQVNLKTTINGNIETVGHIYYKRNFSDNYKFREVAEEEKDFNYRFNYPPQDIFPTDRIDQIITEGIKAKFDQSDVYNHLICTNTDLEIEGRLTDRPNENSILQVFPDIKNLNVLMGATQGKTYQGLRLNVNIYSYLPSERIRNQLFSCYYEIETEEHLLTEIQQLQFL